MYGPEKAQTSTRTATRATRFSGDLRVAYATLRPQLLHLDNNNIV